MEEFRGKLTQEQIEERMKELAKKLNYDYDDLSYLTKALNSTKLLKQPGDGKNSAEYVNSAMATLGDSIITRIVCEYCYKKNMRMRQFTAYKQMYTVNDYFSLLTIALGIGDYAYNEYYFHDDKTAPQHMKVSLNGHDNLIEAIIAAIYLDKGMDYTKKMAKIILDEKNLDDLDEKIARMHQED